MKYHYKSPEELKEWLESKKTKDHPFKNRTFMIVLLDIIVISGIMSGLNYFGYLDRDQIKSTANPSVDGFEFSAALTGLRKTDEAPSFYVNVKNTGGGDRIFPFQSVEQRIYNSVIETYCSGEKSGAYGIVFEEKRIRPDKTAIYNFIPNFPENREGLMDCQFRIVLFRNPESLPDERNIVIAFPGTESLP